MANFMERDFEVPVSWRSLGAVLGTLGVLLAALGATFGRSNGTKSVQIQAEM